MKFTHIALHVHDLDQSIAFYENYCRLRLFHDRIDPRTGDRVVWMSEELENPHYVIVLMPGGSKKKQAKNDYGHLGFAVETKEKVKDLAKKAKADNCLVWDVMDEPYPVGTLCGVSDPDGNVVEFSFGQPLGK